MLATFSASGVDSTKREAEVTGTATYRERMLLPPNAVFVATLEDISRQDAPTEIIASTTVSSPQTPIEFTLIYDPSKIQPGRTYSVRSRIVVDGELVFTTDTVSPVLTCGVGRSVDLKLIRTSGQP